jgi:hypothetical protein
VEEGGYIRSEFKTPEIYTMEGKMIDIFWEIIKSEDDEMWSWSNVLYAYLDPTGDEIIYIGKAYGKTTTVRTRWTAEDKDQFWADLEGERGITEDKVGVIVGEILLDKGQRLTGELVRDLESLLIKKVKPWGNITSRKNRISRPGMQVRCGGNWPGGEFYQDNG